jgi:hypothetical protein
MGGAVAMLSAFALEEEGFAIRKIYAFEAPRVGNQAFADAFDERFMKKLPVFRLTHYKDPVVHLPPQWLEFEHVCPEVYYNETSGYRICSNFESNKCADQWEDIPAMLWSHASDHCNSPLVSSGDICNPVGCLKSANNISAASHKVISKTMVV